MDADVLGRYLRAADLHGGDDAAERHVAELLRTRNPSRFRYIVIDGLCSFPRPDTLRCRRLLSWTSRNYRRLGHEYRNGTDRCSEYRVADGRMERRIASGLEHVVSRDRDTYRRNRRSG